LLAPDRWRPDRICLPALRRILADDNKDMRIRVISLIAGMGSDARSAFPDLVQQLQDPDDNVRHWAIQALGAIRPDPKDVVPVLLDALSDGSVAVRESAAYALGSFPLHAKPGFAALVNLMNEQAAKGDLSSAVNVLSKMGPDGVAAVFPPIMDLLHHQN